MTICNISPPGGGAEGVLPNFGNDRKKYKNLTKIVSFYQDSFRGAEIFNLKSPESCESRESRKKKIRPPKS